MNNHDIINKELIAYIKEMRDALKCIDEDLVNPVYYTLVKEALANTPASIKLLLNEA